MRSNQQILADLRLMQEAGQPVELLSTYKGVPFICRAEILEIEPDKAHLKALDPSMICLRVGEQTRVLGSDYFEPARAEVLAFDLSEGLVELGGFTYVGTKLGERMIVRVEPKESIPVEIATETQNAQGELADISLNGVGLRLKSTDFTALLRPGTQVNLSLNLPTGAIQSNGTVMSVTRLDQGFRLAVRFNQSGAEKSLIFQYLVQRRAEIEAELNQAYTSTLAGLRK